MDLHRDGTTDQKTTAQQLMGSPNTRNRTRCVAVRVLGIVKAYGGKTLPRELPQVEDVQRPCTNPWSGGQAPEELVAPVACVVGRCPVQNRTVGFVETSAVNWKLTTCWKDYLLSLWFRQGERPPQPES